MLESTGEKWTKVDLKETRAYRIHAVSQTWSLREIELHRLPFDPDDMRTTAVRPG